MDSLLPLKRAAEWLERHWNVVKYQRLAIAPALITATKQFSVAHRTDEKRVQEHKMREQHTERRSPSEDGESMQFTANTLSQPISGIDRTNTKEIQENQLDTADVTPGNGNTQNGRQTQPSFSGQDVQLVTVNLDGVETFALTMTAEFAQQLQTNILSYRNLDGLDNQIRNLNGRLQYVQEQIDSIQGLLSKAHEKKQQQDSSERLDDIDKEVINLIQHKDSLQRSSEDIAQALEAQQVNHQIASLAKKNHEGVLYDLLKQPLQQCGVLAVEESVETPATEIIDVQLDNSCFYTNSGHDEVQSQRSQTASELNKADLREQLHEKETKLEKAREDFDGFDAEYEKNLAEYYEDRATGTHNLSKTVFDNYYVNVKHEYTKELIDAEAELRLIRHEAREAGLKHDALDESIFQDNPFDGYGESMEDDMIRCAPVARIEAWLEAFSTEAFNGSGANSMLQSDCDDWNLRLVEMGDSVSCVGNESQSRKIRRWEEIRQTELL